MDNSFTLSATQGMLDEAELDCAYELFCSHRDQPWSKSLFKTSLLSPASFCIKPSANSALSDALPSICGYVMTRIILDQAEIEDICVAPGLSRRGLGKALMDAVCEYLASQAICECFLEVRQSNQAAIALYKKAGFKQVGLRKNYYQALLRHDTQAKQNDREDALIFKRFF